MATIMNNCNFIANIKFSNKYSIIPELTYSFSKYVDGNGYGNCRNKRPHGSFCYVNQPSTCQDLMNSTAAAKHGGYQYSHVACERKQGTKI